MKKPRQKHPRWITNLRSLMESQGMNPRSLSLKAGLNATAVRDMLEGRTRFPRYDTVLALSKALGVTPAILMGDPESEDIKKIASLSGGNEDLELLTEIIARLQEVIEEYKYQVTPQIFATMAASLYRRMRVCSETNSKLSFAALQPKIYDLLEYEALRNRLHC